MGELSRAKEGEVRKDRPTSPGLKEKKLNFTKLATAEQRFNIANFSKAMIQSSTSSYRKARFECVIVMTIDSVKPGFPIRTNAILNHGSTVRNFL